MDRQGWAITGLPEPTGDDHAATKGYVDAGGGSLPVQEFIVGNAVSIADGSFGTLTWDTNDGGPDLLDLTDPTAPSFKEAGVYAVTVNVYGNDMTVGGSLDGNLTFNTSGANCGLPTATANAGQTFPNTGATLVATVEAGETITLTVSNHDGAQAIDFQIAGNTVQKLG